MLDKELEQRVAQFEVTFRQIMTAVEYFNKDILESISALRDGYPKLTIVSCGSIAESILKRVWIKENIKGNPAEKTREPLLQVLKDYLERLIYDYLRDIQVARNRAAHGEIILEDDAVEVLRKLSTVINWYLTKYESPKQGDDSPTSAVGRQETDHASGYESLKKGEESEPIPPPHVEPKPLSEPVSPPPRLNSRPSVEPAPASVSIPIRQRVTGALLTLLVAAPLGALMAVFGQKYDWINWVSTIAALGSLVWLVVRTLRKTKRPR